jgi:hypothetical protein
MSVETSQQLVYYPYNAWKEVLQLPDKHKYRHAVCVVREVTALSHFRSPKYQPALTS